MLIEVTQPTKMDVKFKAKDKGLKINVKKKKHS